MNLFLFLFTVFFSLHKLFSALFRIVLAFFDHRPGFCSVPENVNRLGLTGSSIRRFSAGESANQRPRGLREIGKARPRSLRIERERESQTQKKNRNRISF